MLEKIKVFCLYQPQDRGAVQQVAERLHAEGMDARLDRGEFQPGAVFHKRVERNSNTHDVAVVFFTKQSRNDRWLKADMDKIILQVIQNGFKLIPVSVDASEKIPVLLKRHAFAGVQNLDPLINRIFVLANWSMFLPRFLREPLVSDPHNMLEDINYYERRAAEAPGGECERRELALAKGMLAQLYAARQDLDPGLRECRMACRLLEELAGSKPDRLDDRYHQSACLALAGEMLFASDPFHEARDYCLKAVEILERLVIVAPNWSIVRLELRETAAMLGAISLAEGDRASAQQWFSTSLNHATHILQLQPECPAFQFAMATSLRDYAPFSQTHEEAMTRITQAHRILQVLHQSWGLNAVQLVFFEGVKRLYNRLGSSVAVNIADLFKDS